MKISYNWLKEYLALTSSPAEIAEVLTNTGLEVSSVDTFHSIPGGLAGLVVGQVLTTSRHPNADKLVLTSVNIGNAKPLQIVCGAPNVSEGQKVIVAPPGTRLHHVSGKSLLIEETTIRGEVSEGMICAEDEIGIGPNHDEIIVLDKKAKVGMPVKQLFKITADSIFEIELTPNRIDGASHLGVARDIAAVLSLSKKTRVKWPSVKAFAADNNDLTIPVHVKDVKACPRYSAVTISNVKVAESPRWLKERLQSIGLKPVNNVVDVTNFVLHECGQPLHAFDASKIEGGKVVVQKLPAGTKFATLDSVQKELSADDLMICHANGGMCIAGVFGGIESSVSEKTKHVFLESACFDPVHIRRTAKLHGLNTDASFRFERGTNPEGTLYALKRASMLIKEVAGGSISSEVIDIYAKPTSPVDVPFSYANCDRLIGQQLNRKKMRNILESLDFKTKKETKDGLLLSVPSYRVEVRHEADVVEEVLRIYGYNKIEAGSPVRETVSLRSNSDKEKEEQAAAQFLTSLGFHEIISNSLTDAGYYSSSTIWKAGNSVPVLNPLNSNLNSMRQTMLFSGLEAMKHNMNRQQHNLRFFEYGNTYKMGKGKGLEKYTEERHLALFVSGQKRPETWAVSDANSDFFHLKGIVEALLRRFVHKDLEEKEIEQPSFVFGLSLGYEGNIVAELGAINPELLSAMDIESQVWYAYVHWHCLLSQLSQDEITYTELPKYPVVRRDLALLVDKKIKFGEMKSVAEKTTGKLLQKVNLFDVYEGEGIPAGKRSCAISLILMDDNKTLTDTEVDDAMQRLIKAYHKELGAEIR